MMDLLLLSLGTLLPEAPCYVFYATMHQVYCRFDTDGMAFSGILILYKTHTHTHTHTHTKETEVKTNWNKNLIDIKT